MNGMTWRQPAWQKPSSRTACCSSAGLPDTVATAYQTVMAASPPPILFDRALLRARLRRAERLGAATFLLDRVAEEMTERLQAVLRKFVDAADIGTPVKTACTALAEQVNEVAHVDLPDRESESLPLASGTLDLAVS